MKNSNCYPFRIGKFRCTIIKDSDFTYQAKEYVTNASLAKINEQVVKFHGKPDAIPSPFIALWIDTGEQQILIDTGSGYSEKPLAFQGHEIRLNGQLLRVMREEGIDPAAIDQVILTHFHPDHIGGIFSENGQLNFPNARFVFFEEEWDFWFSEKGAQMPPLFTHFIRHQIAPLKNYRTLSISEKKTEIAPGIKAIFAPGHTPGHMIVSIKSDGKKLVYGTDTVLHPMLMEKPGWKSVFDYDPDLAHRTRIRFLTRAADDKELLCMFHFPFPGLGHVMQEDEHWIWKAMKAKSAPVAAEMEM